MLGGEKQTYILPGAFVVAKIFKLPCRKPCIMMTETSFYYCLHFAGINMVIIVTFFYFSGVQVVLSRL